MFVYLSKKISIPNNVELKSIAWCKKDGYIACGGEEGLLKVLKLETSGRDGAKGLAAPSNLSINQNLEGHNGAIQVIVWNEIHQKLTTSDQQGLIIVWMMYKGSWYEEMINNRNRSVVKDMAWNAEGQRICIVYEDGVVIVGSVDGNRLWGKEIKGSLVAVEWSANGKFLLFGLSTGEVHIYDNTGNYLSKSVVNCLNPNDETTLIRLKWHHSQESSGDVPTPALAVVYANGALQLMRTEADTDPIVKRLDKLKVVDAQWNPNGSMLAIAGHSLDAPEGDQNVIHFITPTGDHLRSLKVPGKEISGCSWEGSGLRIALAVDSHIFFANIRPAYKWGFCGQTVVYSFQRPDRTEPCVTFWETKLDEVFCKYIKDLLLVSCYGDHCLIISRSEDANGPYYLQLCNGIGTPVDFKYIEIEPVFVAVTGNNVVVASKEAFYLWQYNVPRRTNKMDFSASMARRANVTERVRHVDDMTSIITDDPATDVRRAFQDVLSKEKTTDSICSVAASNRNLLIARESGTIQLYQLPGLSFTKKIQISFRPLKMAVNCNDMRISVISAAGILNLIDLETGTSASELSTFERKDVWDMKWDEEDDKLLAVMEKTRLYVFRGTEAEEPVITSGYICQFKDLTVRTVLLDEIMLNPDHPQKDMICDVEIKTLRDAKLLFERGGLSDAAKFIDQNPHPKLWNLLAEFALQCMDLKLAEHAFVHLKDYAGIQFVKKVNNIQSDNLRKAEIAAYFGRFDEAEKMYLDADRRDLAIALRKKLGDWFRVLQLLQIGSMAGDDIQMEEAWNAVGDYYADRQKWRNAVNHYLPGRNHEKLAECYYMLEDYDNLEKLMKSLPENHRLLVRLGDIFSDAGMCQQAVECYKKCNSIKSALDTCIQLNQWDEAVQLAKSHHIPDIESLLAKYAEKLIGDPEKSFTVIQLYRKAGRFLDAAKQIYNLAEEQKSVKAAPLRLKKMYVLAALLVEQYHEQNKTKLVAGEKGKRNLEAQAALSGLLREDSTSVVDSKLIDHSWRGAEAYHFYILAQRQLYDGFVDSAMKTALHLTEYDDIIDPVDIYSILALSSCASRQFSVCNKAFIKLESLETLSAEQRQTYESLALQIFSKNSPKDSRANKAECTGCETLIPDYCQVCPSCDTKFPTCIVTGKPLMDYQFWLCPVCKHRAYEQEIASHKFCPLCHTDILSGTEGKNN